MQSLPALKLKPNQTQFRFGFCVFHCIGVTVGTSRVHRTFGDYRAANGPMADRPLLLADDPLFKIKAALPPSKNFCQSSFAFERYLYGCRTSP